MSSSVYNVVELIGSSPYSWERATANAIEEATLSISSDLRVAEVIEMDLLVEKGKVLAYRSKVRLSYKPPPDSQAEVQQYSSAEGADPITPPQSTPRSGGDPAVVNPA